MTDNLKEHPALCVLSCICPFLLSCSEYYMAVSVSGFESPASFTAALAFIQDSTPKVCTVVLRKTLPGFNTVLGNAG